MNKSKRAEELIERFTSGASCGMAGKGELLEFVCREIAREMGKKAITKPVVMKYFLRRHNRILIELVKRGRANPQKAFKCRVYPGGTKKHPFLYHGKVCVCSITKLQASLLHSQVQRLWGTPRKSG